MSVTNVFRRLFKFRSKESYQDLVGSYLAAQSATHPQSGPVYYPYGCESYKDFVAHKIQNDEFEILLPDVPADLVKLQFLADTIADYVDWVKPVYLKYCDPDTTEDADALNILQEHYSNNHPHVGSFPVATFIGESDMGEEGKEVVLGQSVIIFFHKRSMTVGVLLYTLANFSYPYCRHGVEFEKSLRHLQHLWDTIYCKYGII